MMIYYLFQPPRRFYGEKSIISVFKSIIIFIPMWLSLRSISAFRIVYES
jgi:hypothetical protein